MSLITASLERIRAPERRMMGVACGAHALHDGYTDLLYVLLPLWQAEFGLWLESAISSPGPAPGSSC